MGRNTGTGNVLERIILPALKHGEYDYKTQVNVGKRPAGGSHKVDVVAQKQDMKILLSLKWQQVSGTAEQKVPFEVICLLKALRNNKGDYQKAYIVLGGGGWSLRDFYIEGGLNDYLNNASSIKIVSLESFIALANNGKL